MSNNILFIFEGEKTEASIISSMQSCYLNKNEHVFIKCVYGAEIYQLYRQIIQDDDLDTFNLLKERSTENQILLQDYIRDDFAEIYLFFDYDGHSTLACDDNLNKLLNLFNEETDKGKLYISYPMVEALKHICDFETFEQLRVSCRTNIRYKELVATSALIRLQNYKKYDETVWNELIDAHLKKVNSIVNEAYELPQNLIDQPLIFKHQLQKHISIDAHVAVVSAFPLFIHDYYGNKEIIRRLRGT